MNVILPIDPGLLEAPPERAADAHAPADEARPDFEFIFSSYAIHGNAVSKAQ